MSEPLVSLVGVGRTFAGQPPVHVLEDVDLNVQHGELLAIVGPSGSGKSTLLNVLGLLDVPTTGRYLLGGVDTTFLGQRRRADLRAAHLGFVFQAFHLLPHLSVLENTSMGGLYLGLPSRQRVGRAMALLDRVGVSHRRHARPRTLSGGERQRVAIARALVAQPSVLLADEPTGNLDSGSAAAVLDLISELNAEGTTVVVITHDRTVAARATRQVHIVDGRVSS